jgi:arabinose-5-phosphate isomerase
MRADLMNAVVDDVMTKDPKTVTANFLASEVLKMLNVSKITAVYVTDVGKPVGIVHMHDLLRIGVV